MICDNCRNEFDEQLMFPVNTGRRVQHLCPKCYLKGQSETGLRMAGRRAAINNARAKKSK